MDKQLIAFKLQQKVCPVHGEPPKVEAGPEGFQIECCCEEFRQILDEETRRLVEDDLERDIRHLFE